MTSHAREMIGSLPEHQALPSPSQPRPRRLPYMRRVLAAGIVIATAVHSATAARPGPSCRRRHRQGAQALDVQQQPPESPRARSRSVPRLRSRRRDSRRDPLTCSRQSARIRPPAPPAAPPCEILSQALAQTMVFLGSIFEKLLTRAVGTLALPFVTPAGCCVVPRMTMSNADPACRGACSHAA